MIAPSPRSRGDYEVCISVGRMADGKVSTNVALSPLGGQLALDTSAPVRQSSIMDHKCRRSTHGGNTDRDRALAGFGPNLPPRFPALAPMSGEFARSIGLNCNRDGICR